MKFVERGKIERRRLHKNGCDGAHFIAQSPGSGSAAKVL
jgi:hypothetical protein